MNKLVSVVIPSYNRTTTTLKRAVESIYRQSYPELEVIVVDDNKDRPVLSKDIKEFCLPYGIRYIRSNGLGGAGARNVGIRTAVGEYIAFLDDDDEWLPEKLSSQIKLFADPDVGLVYSRGYTIIVKADGTISRRCYATDSYFLTEVGYQDLLRKNYIGTTTQIVVRRNILLKIGGFDESLPSRQDYDLCLRIAQEYRCIGVDSYLFNHYIHNSGQITADPHRNMVGYQMILRKYKKDICCRKNTYCGFCYRIARCARADRSYFIFLRYTFLACINNPRHFRKAFKKCLE